MTSVQRPLTWQEALHEYRLHLSATRAEKTVRFDTTQINQFVKWAEENAVPLEEFGKRHMDRYVVYRRDILPPLNCVGRF
jgi:hypothetical protein